MSFDPERITYFAKTDARGNQVPFGIKAKDRQRHMYVVGKTGMGKSTLLENMAAQDIQNGEGMAFIDPHGSAAETLLDYVPEHRINDVIYFAPFDLNNPVSFNVMEDVGPDKRHLVVSGLMSTFKKIWVDAWSARMEYILTNALLVLIEYPDTTLLSVNRLFSDKAYRTQVVDYCKDPAVKAFWTEEFANYTERFAADALPAIQNKIGQFTGNPLIRNIIGQPHSSFDIRKIMDDKKILIINLSKGLVGETNANLLGSMLTTRIYLAAMSRADLPVAQMKTMPNFYFYVDEFQSFANATFANILSEARKYHLNLIIAHQYIAQMEEEVRDAVFGNVGTTVSFRVGPFDAEVLETVFTPRFLAADLVNLGFAQVYLTLMIDGIGSQPFSAITLPPVERPHSSCKDMVIASSRKNYAKTRESVEQIVIDLHTPKKPEPAANKKTAPGAEDPRDRLKAIADSHKPKPAAVSTTQPLSQPKPLTPNPTVAVSTEPRKEFKKEIRPPQTEQEKRNAEAAKARIESRGSFEKITDTKFDKKPDSKFGHDRKPNEQRQVNAKSAPDLKAVLTKLSNEEKIKTTKPTTETAVDLKSALKAVLDQVPKPNPNVVEVVPKPNPIAEAQVVPKELEPAPAAKVVSDTRLELERLAEEAEAAFRDLDNEVSKPAKVDDPLAVKKIEKLFKQGGHERSPFAS